MARVVTTVSWLLAIGVVVAGLLVAGIIRHNLRVCRVRRAYRALPDDVKNRVLGLVQEAASERTSLTFLRLERERKCAEDDGLLQSHAGGVPYMESGEHWPPGHPATFLLQVRLDEPVLGRGWQGRLLTVFLVFDSEQVVRSYAIPALDRYVAASAPVALMPCIPLIPIRFPMEGRECEFPASPSRLCEMVPAIPQLLGEFTDDPAGLLSQILRPDVYGYNLEAPDIAYAGGEPMLIQNPHEATCNECGEPMRFLFQFGEVIPGIQLADGGVCYVYGCDGHPHHCKGFLDSH